LCELNTLLLLPGMESKGVAGKRYRRSDIPAHRLPLFFTKPALYSLCIVND
jgi:hypothetical protein